MAKKLSVSLMCIIYNIFVIINYTVFLILICTKMALLLVFACTKMTIYCNSKEDELVIPKKVVIRRN